MSDPSKEIGGWSREQAAFNLFEKMLYTYDNEQPRTIDDALALYAKCISVVQYGSHGVLGQKIGNMND